MTPSKVVGDLQIGDKEVTLNHLAFEDVSPINNGNFPASHVSFQGSNA